MERRYDVDLHAMFFRFYFFFFMRIKDKQHLERYHLLDPRGLLIL